MLPQNRSVRIYNLFFGLTCLYCMYTYLSRYYIWFFCIKLYRYDNARSITGCSLTMQTEDNNSFPIFMKSCFLINKMIFLNCNRLFNVGPICFTCLIDLGFNEIWNAQRSNKGTLCVNYLTKNIWPSKRRNFRLDWTF